MSISKNTHKKSLHDSETKMQQYINTYNVSVVQVLFNVLKSQVGTIITFLLISLKHDIPYSYRPSYI